MNSSLPNQTVSRLSLDEMLVLYGSSWFSDIMWVFIYMPASAIGCVLNLINFLVFSRKEFSIKLYTYFKLMTLCCCIFCFISIWYPLAMTKRFFLGKDTHLGAIYICHVYIPICNLLFYFITVLDILILIDRLATFIPKLKSVYNKQSANRLCLIAFLICLALDFPYFFVFVPKPWYYRYLDEQSNVVTLTFYIIGASDFAVSLTGTIITYLIYVFRDILTIVIIVILNIISIYYLRRHLSKRAQMLKKNTPGVDKENESMSASTEAGSSGNAQQKTKTKSSKSKEGKVDRKASIMVAITCTMTIITNSMLFSSIIYFYFAWDVVASAYGQMAEFSTLLKYILYIAIFYNFNSNYKTEFKKMFGLEAKK
nr:G protein-coupled receptor [Proales similis]